MAPDQLLQIGLLSLGAARAALLLAAGASPAMARKACDDPADFAEAEALAAAIVTLHTAPMTNAEMCRAYRRRKARGEVATGKSVKTTGKPVANLSPTCRRPVADLSPEQQENLSKRQENLSHSENAGGGGGQAHSSPTYTAHARAVNNLHKEENGDSTTHIGEVDRGLRGKGGDAVEKTPHSEPAGDTGGRSAPATGPTRDANSSEIPNGSPGAEPRLFADVEIIPPPPIAEHRRASRPRKPAEADLKPAGAPLDPEGWPDSSAGPYPLHMGLPAPVPWLTVATGDAMTALRMSEPEAAANVSAWWNEFLRYWSNQAAKKAPKSRKRTQGWKDAWGFRVNFQVAHFQAVAPARSHRGSGIDREAGFKAWDDLA